jgi:hypothetical protein
MHAKFTQALQQIHAESSRDRMRRIFDRRSGDLRFFVGGAARAPQAAALLGRYLQPSAIPEIGNGHASSRLLGVFAGESLISVSGLRVRIRGAQHRREVCQFIDNRLDTRPTSSSSSTTCWARHGGSADSSSTRIEALFASLTPADRHRSPLRRSTRGDRPGTRSRATVSCASQRMPMFRKSRAE